MSVKKKYERGRERGREHSRISDGKRAIPCRGWKGRGRSKKQGRAGGRKTTLRPRCSLRLTELEVNLSLDSGSILRRAGRGDGDRRPRRAFDRAEAILYNFWHSPGSQSRADVPRVTGAAPDAGVPSVRP